jgi:glucose-6-phosphate dehydrogenase assembly protein OpcA
MASSITKTETLEKEESIIASWSGGKTNLAQLGRQIRKLRHLAVDEEGYPLARASVMNLIIYAEGEKQIETANMAIEEMALTHPSRTILITPEKGEEFALDAAVELHRHPLASHGLVFERIRLKPKGVNSGELDTLVIPLLIPHLYSFLLWLGDPNPKNAALKNLLSISDRLVIDSSLGSIENLVELSSIILAGKGEPKTGSSTQVLSAMIGDIAWIRAEGLRTTLARVFDEPKYGKFLDGIEKIEIFSAREQDEDIGPVELLFAGWIVSRLGYSKARKSSGGVSVERGLRRQELKLKFVPSGRNSPLDRRAQLLPSLKGFRLFSAYENEKMYINFEMTSRECRLEVQALGEELSVKTFRLRALSEAETLGAELGQFGRNRVYEDSLLSAARMALALKSSYGKLER